MRQSIGIFDEKEGGVVVFDAVRAADGEVDVLDVFVSGKRLPDARAATLVRRHSRDIDRRYARASALRNGTGGLLERARSRVIHIGDRFTLGPKHTAVEGFKGVQLIDWSQQGGMEQIMLTEGDIKKALGTGLYKSTLAKVEAEDMFPIGDLTVHETVRRNGADAYAQLTPGLKRRYSGVLKAIDLMVSSGDTSTATFLKVTKKRDAFAMAANEAARMGQIPSDVADRATKALFDKTRTAVDEARNVKQADLALGIAETRADLRRAQAPTAWMRRNPMGLTDTEWDHVVDERPVQLDARRAIDRHLAKRD